LLTIPEVADVMNVTAARAYELARENVLPVVRLGRQVRIDSERFEAFLSAGGQALPEHEDGEA
jgi:excisionase family DNA binding protein